MVVVGLMVVLSNNYVKLLRDWVMSKTSDRSVADAQARTYDTSGLVPGSDPSAGKLRNPLFPTQPGASINVPGVPIN